MSSESAEIDVAVTPSVAKVSTGSGELLYSGGLLNCDSISGASDNKLEVLLDDSKW